MTYTVCNIPMALIPHPQGPWLEGINPVTNLQWRKGVEPLMADGAKYCLLEPHYRGGLAARQLGSLQDVLDTIGHEDVPRDWIGSAGVITKEIDGRGALAVFEWRRHMTRSGFDFEGDRQPVVDVSWYHAQGWALSQGGLYLLTDAQWEWSARGGERNLEYATASGKLVGPDGKKLAHYSVKTRAQTTITGERTTIDVDDPKYADGPFGLRHKTGNVWEWVEKNPNKEYHYAQFGGSWCFVDPVFLRVASRIYVNPDVRFSNAGFRVGAPVPSEKKEDNQYVEIHISKILSTMKVLEESRGWPSIRQHAIRNLRKHLNADLSPFDRRWAARGLAEALEDLNEEVRKAARRTLNHPILLPYLIEDLRNEDTEIRRRALAALLALGKKVVSPFLDAHARNR